MGLEASLLYAALGFVAGGYVGRKTRGIPLLRKRAAWAIGIYGGDSPFAMSPRGDVKNPVMTAGDVTDVRADFVADPFMIPVEGKWHMFFEVMNHDGKRGQIGLAVSPDGLSWKYERIVLDEPFHLSYPFVFQWEGRYYMLPEAGETKSVRLYEAVNFPYRWKLKSLLLEGYPFLDASVIRYNGTWWLFASLPRNNTLLLYFADRLTGPWSRHPQSPVVMGDPAIARPGGRPLVIGGRVCRFGQDALTRYGNKVKAFEVIELTAETYREQELSGKPVIGATGSGWNALGMHTLDAHEIVPGKWLACVDGEGTYSSFGLISGRRKGRRR